MTNTSNVSTKYRKNIVSTLILSFCALLLLIVFAVLIFVYEPNLNSPGALGSACMDIVCMLILLILIVSLTFGRDEIGRTTRLFLELMLGTMWALFFDFLTWSLDGSLKYGGWTYIFTIASLCSASILAAVLVLYLSSYMNDMYELKGAHFHAQICAICDVAAFVVTLILGITHSAFEFVNGHYEVGALYDAITVIPILTLIYMTIYAIRNVKILGMHDVLSIIIYIFTMICGALIEASYGIGATYVSVSIADVFIFVMLQNRLIDRTKKQKEILAEKITSQYDILESMAGIYSHVNYVDFNEMTARLFNQKDGVVEHLNLSQDSHTGLNRKLYANIRDDMKDKFWSFTDLSSLSERMSSEKIITAEFVHNTEGWIRAQYIRIGDSVYSPIDRVIFAIRNIDEEKKNVEKWIKKSNTDEVSGFFNRHAYEDEIIALEKGKIRDNFVYVSMDVNGLKIVNDTLGHNAGDELIVGACSCMRRCFGAYGKLYRIGGDEFVALIYVNESTLEDVLRDFETETKKWQGTLIENLTISIGYVTKQEAGDMSVQQMAVLADRRMYDNKTSYYQRKGIDRRGQKNAHVALCALYTKILEVNITNDKYKIINMDPAEQIKDKGFSSEFSEWIADFGRSGHVHPDDLEEYLAQTDSKNISDYFRNNKTPMRIYYRRKSDTGYKKVLMELIPANNYTDEVQTIYLYVKDI